MAPIRLLVALLATLAAPASAEFCYLSGASGSPEIFELAAPRCAPGNRLIFERRRGPGGYLENFETFITESWPGFMGSDEKCAKAAAGAQVVVSRPGSIIIGKAVLWAPQIWAFKGSCSEFGYKFRAKLREQKDAKYEDVLEAVGAGKGSMNELLTSLIEVGEKQK